MICFCGTAMAWDLAKVHRKSNHWSALPPSPCQYRGPLGGCHLVATQARAPSQKGLKDPTSTKGRTRSYRESRKTWHEAWDWRLKRETYRCCIKQSCAWHAVERMQLATDPNASRFFGQSIPVELPKSSTRRDQNLQKACENTQPISFPSFWLPFWHEAQSTVHLHGSFCLSFVSFCSPHHLHPVPVPLSLFSLSFFLPIFWVLPLAWLSLWRS